MTAKQQSWNHIASMYQRSLQQGVISDSHLQRLDQLITSDLENARNGVTLLCTLAPEYLCRYLRFDGEDIYLQDSFAWSSQAETEQALLEQVRTESLWQDCYQAGNFEVILFGCLKDIPFADLKNEDLDFLLRVSKKMSSIPAGDFWMGPLVTNYQTSSRIPHVTLSKGFYVSKYPVTQVLWQMVTGVNPSYFDGVTRPVEQVTWLDCILFCNQCSLLDGYEPVYRGLENYVIGQSLSFEEGKVLANQVQWSKTANGYRLLTEAEWEYAARAGVRELYAGSDRLDEVGWYSVNSHRQTQPVGQKNPNGFGLYDMSGNVEEWVYDAYLKKREKYLVDPVYEIGEFRVCRGGNWKTDLHTHVANRSMNGANYASWFIGLRLARNLMD